MCLDVVVVQIGDTDEIDIITRGFVFNRANKELLSEIKNVVKESTAIIPPKWVSKKDMVSRKLSKFLYKRTGRQPLIVVDIR